ncbi:TorF family putative porin [Oleiharenicola lentus]|uniref:TorF family putative porin n=1 Tax=Oleiharenicola lentus TaxID=2508720 RepID=UPI003F669CCE
MKKTALILAALVAGASLSAQDAAAPSYSVTVDFPYASKYVFRGVQYAEGSIQPSVKLTTGSFYAGVWTNQPITSNIDNEVDFFAGYGFKLSDTFSLDVGATAYYYPELDDSTGLDNATYEGYVGLNGTFGAFTTGLYAYNDFTLESFTVQGTVGYSVALSDKASFNLLGTIGKVYPDSGDDYTYYGVGATVPYKLTDSATLTGGVQYATHDIDGLEDGHLWFTVGLTVTF